MLVHQRIDLVLMLSSHLLDCVFNNDYPNSTAISCFDFVNCMTAKDFWGYVLAQCVGALLAALVLAAIINMTNLGGISVTGLGANGYGTASAVGLSACGALIVEVILTCIFVLTILGVTSSEKTAAIAGLVIGLTLTFVHIMGIPLTGTSVNPARSFGPALVLGGQALCQLWVFVVGPFIGAALAALIWKGFNKAK